MEFARRAQLCAQLLPVSKSVGWQSVEGTEGVFGVLVTVDLPQLRDTVRRGDYEHYLCGNLLPSAAREAFFVMRAINLELASVREATRGNAATAALRFAFWRAALDGAYSDTAPQGLDVAATQHPLAAPLRTVVRRHDLTRRWFERMIEARELDMTEGAGGEIADIERYGEHTQGSLLYLTLEALGERNVDADHAASHIGKALAIVTLLRATPFHCASGYRWFPDAVMGQHGLSEGMLFGAAAEDADPAVRERICGAVYDLACVAHSHLRHARDMESRVPDAAVPALLPAEIAGMFLERLEQEQFDVFSPSLARKKHLSLQWRLLKHTVKHTY